MCPSIITRLAILILIITVYLSLKPNQILPCTPQWQVVAFCVACRMFRMRADLAGWNCKIQNYVYELVNIAWHIIRMVYRIRITLCSAVRANISNCWKKSKSWRCGMKITCWRSRTNKQFVWFWLRLKPMAPTEAHGSTDLGYNWLHSAYQCSLHTTEDL